jgi:trimeric autotransporter adhesin
VLLSTGDAATANGAAFYIDQFNGATQARRMALNGDGSVVVRSNTTQANTGVTLPANGGSWSSLSDRRLKTAVVAVDPVDVLDRLVSVPIATWSYTAQGERVRHMGPMAQDFAAAFGLGEDDTHIATVDADGVALAAIQGLDAKLAAQRDALAGENAALRRTLEALARRIAALEGAAHRGKMPP